MKNSVLTVMFFTGMLVYAAEVRAEVLDGTVTSIDAKNKRIQIAPSGSAAPQADVSVSVVEFIKSNGLAKLNDLDVGKRVSMTVQKNSGGQWAMTELKKPDVLVPAPQEGATFLKATGESKTTALVREMLRKMKIWMQ